MASLRVPLGEALVELLNGHTWDIDCKAARGWRPRADADETAEARMSVVVGQVTSDDASRNTMRHELDVSIVVQRQHGGLSGQEDPVESVDKIDALAQDIADFLADQNTVTLADGTLAHSVGEMTSEIGVDRLDDGVAAVTLTLRYAIWR